MKLEMIPGKVWRFPVWWMDGFCEKKTSILPRFSRLAGVYIDSNEVVIQLKINPLTTEFSLKSFLGNTLTHETFGFKANENKNLPFILEYLAWFSVCCGLPPNNHNDSVVREESDKMGTRTAYLSCKCHQVVPSLGETCVEYGYLKRLVQKKRDILQYHQDQKLSYGWRRKASESEFYFERKEKCSMTREILANEIWIWVLVCHRWRPPRF